MVDRKIIRIPEAVGNLTIERHQVSLLYMGIAMNRHILEAVLGKECSSYLVEEIITDSEVHSAYRGRAGWTLPKSRLRFVVFAK